MTGLSPPLAPTVDPSTPAPAPPRHIAIIMDGNGRWAFRRGKPRAYGHRAGVEAVRRTVRAAGDLGLRHLTLFGFSTENWSRPPDEVEALLGLMRRYVDADLERLAEEGVRIRIIGKRDDLDGSLLDLVERAERRTAGNSEFNLTIAFNYGGRDEIVRAARRVARLAQAGELTPDELDEDRFDGLLDTSASPPIDLLVRTSGEQRISNFLLWQCAYAEFVFLDVLWPDFDKPDLAEAIAIFHARERRFGGVERVDVG